MYISDVLNRLLFVLLTLSGVYATAQQGVSSNQLIQQKLAFYAASHHTGALFIHIDKTVYTNNETVWFSAYLIHHTQTDKKLHTVLSVFLSRDDDKQVALSGNFRMEEKLSFGSLLLPDSIAPGNYHITAYSNVLNARGQPLAVFSAPLVIKSITQQNFSSRIILIDSTVRNGAVRAKISVELKEPKAKTYPAIQYNIGTSKPVSMVLKENETTLSIPEKVLSGKRQLNVTVRYNNQVQHLSAVLPQRNDKGLEVRFYPESGNFSAGLPNRVAWEARTTDGTRLALNGILMEDGKPVDTLETDKYGVGTFISIPQNNSTYTLKILKGLYLGRDTLIALPTVSNTDFALQVPEAAANDTLTVKLHTKEAKQVQVVLHSRNGAYIIFKVNIAVAGKPSKFPLSMLPKGLATMTVLDMQLRPLAERLFFAHYDERLKTHITTDKKTYAKRDSVKVRVKVTDRAGQPLQGIFSVAAVQSNRLKTGLNDVENTLYLNQDMDVSSQDPEGRGFQNKEYLEKTMLTKGWRRYTWQDIMASTAKDTVKKYHSPVTTGNVSRNNKRLKTPVKLISLGGIAAGVIITETDGTFTLNREQLLAEEGKKILLSVGDKNSSAYTIEVNEPYREVNRQLASTLKTATSGMLNNTANTDEQVLKGMDRMYSLETVTVKANKGSDAIYGFKGEPGANACGDFVDPAGHLNYELTPLKDRYKPVIGKLYTKRTDLKFEVNTIWFKVDPVFYTGCTTEENNSILVMDGIYGDKEFYGVSDTSNELQYLSTLFWRPGLATNVSGEAEFGFKTGDIADKFTIVVQGITGDNVISGQENIVVK